MAWDNRTADEINRESGFTKEHQRVIDCPVHGHLRQKEVCTCLEEDEDTE